MSAVRGTILKLQALKLRLNEPIEFYEEHLGPYRELAHTVALQVLVNLRPANADAQLWEKQARDLAARVTASLVNGGNVGLIIALEEQRVDADPANTRNYQLRGLSIADVERFVAAGRVKSAVDAPGKNLDERDDGKSDLQIAWRIMYAIRLQKPGAARLEQHILNFLASEHGGEAESFLPQVLKVWLDVFPPQALADWRAWIARVVSAV